MGNKVPYILHYALYTLIFSTHSCQPNLLKSTPYMKISTRSLQVLDLSLCDTTLHISVLYTHPILRDAEAFFLLYFFVKSRMMSIASGKSIYIQNYVKLRLRGSDHDAIRHLAGAKYSHHPE